MKKRISWTLKLGLFAMLPMALFAAGPIWQWMSGMQQHVQAQNITVQLAPQAQYDLPPKVLRGKPLRIVIPSQNIDLTVIEGSFNPRTKEWTLTKDKAQYAVNSSVANNQGGNTFIYGHDIPQVFRNLVNLKPGDIATVYTENNLVFTYKFRSEVIVPPTDTTIFSYTGAPILTLQTCSGYWSESRRLMTFDFVEVNTWNS